ncbi:hypothetical protein [Butyrivibrio sp. MC2013]|uniref:hypothetical protein n=1 Tax=Butyrivibrio sp. MC2013 TaxID=1280686 RepID=UPI000416398C|nr:hypothetical protein [Butyrivibrio sp. MC2013]
MGNANNNRPSRMVSKGVVISCDYCGSKIDTAKERVCPACGAAYDKDKEWLNRKKESEYRDEVYPGTAPISNNNRNTTAAAPVKKEKKKGANNALIALAFLTVMISSLVIVASKNTHGRSRSYSSKYAQNEEVNVYDYDQYELTDTVFENDGIILDNEYMKVQFTGYYADSHNTWYDYRKLGIQVENKSDQDLKLHFTSCSMNGRSRSSSYISCYELFKKGTTVTFYEKLGEMTDDDVSEIVIDDLEIRDDSYHTLYEVEEPFVIKGNGSTVFEPDLDNCKLIFTNDRADIYANIYLSDENDYNNGYRFLVHNKTDERLCIEDSECRIDGEESGAYVMSNTHMPADYWLSDKVHSLDEKFKDFDKKLVEFNFRFTFEADPSKDFSTGYLDINGLLKD